MADWLHKLGLGLKKSSAKISDGLNDIFNKQKTDSQTLEQLEELLLTADIGIKATTEIIDRFSSRRLDKTADIHQIKHALAQDIENILKPCEKNLNILKHNNIPFVILMTGVNGAGKTTTIGKLAAQLKSKYQISFIAGDTFRAAAVEQLETWGKRCGIRVYKGANGCDAAGLCFDGLQEAIKQKDDIVFIDTAGRLQNKTDLMDELQKIIRVIKKIIPDAPHASLLTIDATTGQNALSQIEIFKQAADINGLIVTKLDGSSKGGIIVAMAKENALPVYYIGVGEQIDDLDIFNAHEYAFQLLEINNE
ncbi:MAG: signal recognition particle-docking protein FtsY [Alphaproteobacteria bacterium]|nr:signal recognition particle-docking protein FtsY [Alphaproteobacteria bacterium]